MVSHLSTWRKRRGFTQNDLANLLEVPQQHISAWESGSRHPRLETALRLASILKCHVDDLFSLQLD
jgi:putative transcriptional regulator